MMGIRYVKRRYIGDQYQSIRVVMKGERMMRVVFSKAGRVRCVSSKMLFVKTQSASGGFSRGSKSLMVGIPYTNASADSTALAKTFSATASSK